MIALPLIAVSLLDKRFYNFSILFYSCLKTLSIAFFSETLNGRIKCIPEVPLPGQLRSGMIFLCEIPTPGDKLLSNFPRGSGEAMGGAIARSSRKSF